METRKKLKELRIEADGMAKAGVASKDDLFAALPTLIELQNAIETLAVALRASKKAAAALSKSCTAYATEHPSVFANKELQLNQQGVLTGDVQLEGAVYHLACGYDGYVRTDAGKMTQEFLQTLPKSWRRARCEIDVSAINKANPTADKLAEYGLCEKPNDVWSEGVGDDAE